MNAPSHLADTDSQPPAGAADADALHERVAQLDRLASIGQLTAGILHEIKNPLNFITNYARLTLELADELTELAARLPPDLPETADATEVVDLIRGNVTRIRDNGMRAERIIQGMLAQTRAEAAHFEPTDLNTLLEEFTKLAYQGVRAADKEFTVSLAFDLDPTVGQVHMAPYEFNRVVLNLVLNACYAVNERRKTQPDSYQPTIAVATRRLPKAVEVRIRDNGDGIPEEIKSKLFTPFFTTKPVGKGTGLGLTLSRDIVTELHHGALTVESEPGVFTEFCITLPV